MGILSGIRGGEAFYLSGAPVQPYRPMQRPQMPNIPLGNSSSGNGVEVDLPDVDDALAGDASVLSQQKMMAMRANKVLEEAFANPGSYSPEQIINAQKQMSIYEYNVRQAKSNYKNHSSFSESENFQKGQGNYYIKDGQIVTDKDGNPITIGEISRHVETGAISEESAFRGVSGQTDKMGRLQSIDKAYQTINEYKGLNEVIEESYNQTKGNMSNTVIDAGYKFSAPLTSESDKRVLQSWTKLGQGNKLQLNAAENLALQNIFSDQEAYNGALQGLAHSIKTGVANIPIGLFGRERQEAVRRQYEEYDEKVKKGVEAKPPKGVVRNKIEYKDENGKEQTRYQYFVAPKSQKDLMPYLAWKLKNEGNSRTDQSFDMNYYAQLRDVGDGSDDDDFETTRISAIANTGTSDIIEGNGTEMTLSTGTIIQGDKFNIKHPLWADNPELQAFALNKYKQVKESVNSLGAHELQGIYNTYAQKNSITTKLKSDQKEMAKKEFIARKTLAEITTPKDGKETPFAKALREKAEKIVENNKSNSSKGINFFITSSMTNASSSEVKSTKRDAREIYSNVVSGVGRDMFINDLVSEGVNVKVFEAYDPDFTKTDLDKGYAKLRHRDGIQILGSYYSGGELAKITGEDALFVNPENYIRGFKMNNGKDDRVLGITGYLAVSADNTDLDDIKFRLASGEEVDLNDYHAEDLGIKVGKLNADQIAQMDSDFVPNSTEYYLIPATLNGKYIKEQSEQYGLKIEDYGEQTAEAGTDRFLRQMKEAESLISVGTGD